MSEWQPIETAPNDGTIIFLYWTEWDGIEVCHNSPIAGYWDAGGDEWWTDDGWVFRPSHWMPLPEAPSE